MLTVLRPIYWSNIIQTQFWDHIWNPLIKANLLDPQYESGIENLFFWLPIVFLNDIPCARTEKGMVRGGVKIILRCCPSLIARD